MWGDASEQGTRMRAPAHAPPALKKKNLTCPPTPTPPLPPLPSVSSAFSHLLNLHNLSEEISTAMHERAVRVGDVSFFREGKK